MGLRCFNPNLSPSSACTQDLLGLQGFDIALMNLGSEQEFSYKDFEPHCWPLCLHVFLSCC